MSNDITSNATQDMATESTSHTSKATKLCHIVKRPDFDGYGFNLHSEKVKPGQYVGKVDANSPALDAGLKEGDRILEVNGVSIRNETHKQVVQRIKAIACEVRLLLLDVDHINMEVNADLHNVETNNHSQNHSTPVSTVSTVSTATGHVTTMPGTSNNISDISVTSIKRHSDANHHNHPDEVDHSVKPNEQSNGIENGKPLVEMKTVPFTSSNEATKTGGLQLPMTAAEMRAKLLSRKKYDPKNEGVDLKKKFEIIQKL